MVLRKSTVGTIVLDKLILGRDKICEVLRRVEKRRKVCRRIVLYEDSSDLDFWLIGHGKGEGPAEGLIGQGFLRGDCLLANYIVSLDDDELLERHRFRIVAGRTRSSDMIKEFDKGDIVIEAGKSFIPNPSAIVVDYVIPYAAFIPAGLSR
tara:strand:+ start:15 stop:467 length:453 start_codon:yes stop_codon:yes gene_type:complete